MEQCEKVEKILYQLKKLGISATKVETELVDKKKKRIISSGFLWKAKTCSNPKTLNEEKYKALVEYYKINVPKKDWDRTLFKYKDDENDVVEVTTTKKLLVPVIKKDVPEKSSGLSLKDIMGTGRKSAGTTYKRTK